MKILLNGIGRIGKAILRIALEEKSFEIVALNELNSDIENITYSINYDSTYGKLDDAFRVNDYFIQNKSAEIEILNYDNLADIDLKSLDIDIIVDASGSKVNTAEFKKLNVKAVFLTHPNKNADINVILGINEEELNLDIHKVISTSSCNATALLPVLKLIDDNKGIEYGDITTVHPLLNHQKVLDSGCIGNYVRDVECNFEFGRSSTQNIIPSRTTTIEACSYVMANINNNIISSSSFRVPTDTVGVINVILFLKEECTKDEIIDLCEEYAANQKFDIFLNNKQSLVSSDFKAESYTTILDHRFTDVKQKKMLKLVVWYDNEWGYASKVVDIIAQGFIEKSTGNQ